MKNSVLSQILEQNARARRELHLEIHMNLIKTHFFPVHVVNSIALVKPDKAKSVEMMLIRMAQSGQISGKVRLSTDHLNLRLCLVAIGRGGPVSGTFREDQSADTEDNKD